MMKVILAALAAALLVGLPQQRTPTFRSSVDLVPVDINIVDRTGRPVSDLSAGDFVLTVDGKPRRIASAEFVEAASHVNPPPKFTHYSTNAGAAAGRLIALVVDQSNIGPARAKLAINAAARFVERLKPSDRVALYAIPGGGPQIDFTANHALVKTMLQKVVGQRTPTIGSYGIGISEAMQLDRGEPTATAAIDRECAAIRDAADLAACRQQVVAEAQETFADARARTQKSLVALRHIVERLAQSTSPKTIVFISEGLVLDRDFSEVSWLAPLASRGQVALYVLQVEPQQFDVSSARMSSSRSSDVHLMQEGLGMMAGLARGSVFRVFGNADVAFNRLALELSGYYLLSFEPEPGDRDGRPHKIKIDVPGRSGIDIRARREFVVDVARTKTDEEMLVDTLRAPVLATEVGLKVTTYTFRHAASPKLRVILAVEIDRAPNPNAKLALAYMLLDGGGKLVASHVEPEVKTPISPSTRSQQYVGAAVADAPGIFTVKVAVIDDGGKRGSVEHPFGAQLNAAGQLRATDLLIAESIERDAAGLVPTVSADFTSDTLHARIELYSDSADVLKNATVTFEVAAAEQSRALDTSVARLQEPREGETHRLAAEGAVPIALLPPGEYVARAVINISGRKAGQVTRPFRVSRAAPSLSASGAAGAVRAPARTAIPFTSRIEAFDRQAVLAPQVVGFFLERMNVGTGGAIAPNAVEHARAGRFEAAAEALKGAAGPQLATVFLSGLAAYAKRDFEAAARQFRETLRLDSEFFPAAFYLGACYAAGGRDREAAAAWQTSLVTESDAPFIYTLLGDALLRLRDIDQALDVLTEAFTVWPENDQVRLRLGTALIMAGKPAEAVRTLDPYLAKHPEDHERHFIVLRALYETAAAGNSIDTPAEDRQRFDRYAAAYVAAGGPQQALVDQWRRFIEKSR